MSQSKKLPEALKTLAYSTLEPLEKEIAEKVDYIKYCYSQNLTDQQFKRIKKDESLLKAVLQHVTTLNHQIDYVLGELFKMQQIASNAQNQLCEIRSENIHLLAMAARDRLKDFKLDAA